MFDVVVIVVCNVVVNVVVTVVVNVVGSVVMINVVVNVLHSLFQWSYADHLGPMGTYDDLLVLRKTVLISKTLRCPCRTNHTVPSRA